MKSLLLVLKSKIGLILEQSSQKPFLLNQFIHVYRDFLEFEFMAIYFGNI
jgi:hypothetical protein